MFVIDKHKVGSSVFNLCLLGISGMAKLRPKSKFDGSP